MSYTISILPGDLSYQIDSDENLLDAGFKNNLALPHGCKAGRCGRCAASLKNGTVEYPEGVPEALEGEEPDVVLTCKAHATSDVTIEFDTPIEQETIITQTIPTRVTTREQLNHDVMRLVLTPLANKTATFKAGQYLDILLQDGRKRSFSMANAPHQGNFMELHIRKVPNGHFTTHVFEKMKEQSLLRVELPMGDFYLREDSNRPLLMVAGGTGFAPIKGVIEHAIEKNIKRPLYFYWGVRSKRDLYATELAEQWANTHENIHFIPVLSQPLEADAWSGKTGWVHDAILEDMGDLSFFDTYLCGPPPMIEAAQTSFMQRGLPKSQLYFDSFEFAAE